MEADPAEVAARLHPERVGTRQLTTRENDGSRTQVRGAHSQASLLLKLAAEADLFHTQEGQPFITFPVGGHCETHSLRGKGSRRWLQRKWHVQYGSTVSAQALDDAFGVLEGKALFEAPQRPVFIRIAEVDGAIFLD